MLGVQCTVSLHRVPAPAVGAWGVHWQSGTCRAAAAKRQQRAYRRCLSSTACLVPCSKRVKGWLCARAANVLSGAIPHTHIDPVLHCCCCSCRRCCRYISHFYYFTEPDARKEGLNITLQAGDYVGAGGLPCRCRTQAAYGPHDSLRQYMHTVQ